MSKANSRGHGMGPEPDAFIRATRVKTVILPARHSNLTLLVRQCSAHKGTEHSKTFPCLLSGSVPERMAKHGHVQIAKGFSKVFDGSTLQQENCTKSPRGGVRDDSDGGTLPLVGIQGEGTSQRARPA